MALRKGGNRYKSDIVLLLHESRGNPAAGCYRPNLTLTCPLCGTRAPGGGDWARATPLPVTSSSSPTACACSSAARRGLPEKSGTTTPPPTSRMTVPRAFAVGKDDDGGGAGTGWVVPTGPGVTAATSVGCGWAGCGTL